MKRAYSTLVIKSIDTTQGIIEGIASTPAMDRMGDVVEPMGAQYNLPIPLLWQHAQDAPVGTVTHIEQRADGLYIRAQLAPAGICEDLDNARAYILAGLCRAFSLGFRPIEYSFLDSGGTHYTAYEVYEISVVTIPANAEATITTIKSFDMNTAPAVEPDTLTNPPPVEPAAVDDTAEAPPPVVQRQLRRVPSAAPALHLVKRQYSIKNALAGALNMAGADDGFEREIAGEMVRRSPGRIFTGVPIPFNALFQTKAAPITGNSGATGGNLSPLTATEYADTLLSFRDGGLPREFLAQRLGVSSYSTNERSVSVPVITGKIAGKVVALDGTIDLSDSASDVDTVEPVTVGARTEVRRSVFYSHGGDMILRQQVGQAIRETIDSCIIGPAAAPPVPAGILDLATQATVSSIDYTEAAYRALREQLRNYLKNPEAPIKFCIPASVADTLAITPRFLNSQQSVLDDSTGTARIAGTEVQLSHEVGNYIMAGLFNEAYLVMFNSAGVDVVANPWTAGSWETGGFELRALVDIGIYLRDPKSILYGTPTAPVVPGP
ncbi:HK97 family phage prohead protease [uncultured Thiodictyon sp.]|uniref:HK97 family phage prohead protease n=1 Tax=uncultured Thiodictyon sp. TaxID=1846217 RepID=UPI0025EDF552|nr:HK97 family phage prohead protease [uncultured Thiodictyon sp.]